MTMAEKAEQRQSPLQGIKVVDVSRFVAGPYCAMMLGDMGADVIKIEKEGSDGDPGRVHPPFVDGVSLFALSMNRNKRGVSVNLRTAEGRELFKRFVAEADGLVENFRPGIMEKMGCGWEELSERNPGLIMARISGFGQEGPDVQRPCFDILAQAMSGIMDTTGLADGPPIRSGVHLTDYVSGLYATIGILTALNARHITGRGQVVDVALLDSAVSMLASAISENLMLGITKKRQGNRDYYGAPATTYRTKDGKWLFITGGAQVMYPRLCRVLGRPDLVDDPRYKTQKDRLGHADELEKIVSDWVAQRTAEEATTALRAEDVGCSKVLSIADVARNEHLIAREQITTVPHPTRGEVPMQGVTIKLTDTPLTIRSGMPAIGEHTDDVLKDWLGLDVQQINDLKNTNAT